MITLETEKTVETVRKEHPCFSNSCGSHAGRLHLPVSPLCNIRCRFCMRGIDAGETQAPGLARAVMPVERVPETVRRAVLLCPGLAVAGVAGPGDALASGHAVEALRLVRKRFPDLLTCLSTNGLMLPEMARTLSEAGIGFVTVTVNAVDPDILAALCAGVVLGGRLVAGREAAAALIERQERGIRLAVRLGIKVKINTVVAPGINDSHTGEVARNAASWGAGRINLIPLIPGHGMAAGRAPSGAEMSVAKEAASQWLELSERCGRCRADACGIPGGKDVSGWLYGAGPGPAAFSHG